MQIKYILLAVMALFTLAVSMQVKADTMRTIMIEPLNYGHTELVHCYLPEGFRVFTITPYIDHNVMEIKESEVEWTFLTASTYVIPINSLTIVKIMGKDGDYKLVTPVYSSNFNQFEAINCLIVNKEFA